MSEPAVLVCLRVADHEPARQSVVDTCAGCGCAVWRALSSPEAPRIECMPCALKSIEAAEARGEQVEHLPPTSKQLKDIRGA